MTISLHGNRYGKSRVRLVKVARGAERHELVELTANIRLEGDFEAVHLAGDNRSVLPTDTMKNTVYALAKSWDGADIESFGRMLGGHFLEGNPQVRRAAIELAQSQWTRMGAHSFVRGPEEKRCAKVACTRGGVEIESGIENLIVLKTTGSAFEGYRKDRFTTLKETADRILATAIRAWWKYSTPDLPFGDCWRMAREAMLGVFSGRHSVSAQQTAYQMGEAAMQAVPEIASIRLSLPNKHCLLIDMAPFGMDNPNEIFVPTDEPHGLIEVSLRRG
jgi:urate oxidase